MLLKLEQWQLNVCMCLVHMFNDLGIYLQLTNSGMFMGKLSGSESSKALEGFCVCVWHFLEQEMATHSGILLFFFFFIYFY